MSLVKPISAAAAGLCLIVSLATGCKGGNAQPELTDEDKAGQVFQEGDKVKAQFGETGNKKNGKVLETYGKLVRIRFYDRHIGWVNVKEVEPVGAIQRYPEGDKCEFEIDDKVRAPWSNNNRYFGGTVDQLHGALAHIQFDDGDKDWVKCKRLKPPAEKKSGGSTSASSGGGGGSSANSEAVRKCRNKCPRQCLNQKAMATCVAKCRRACEGR